MQKNVLIFPAGTEIAFEIVNALKYSKFVKLFGGASAKDHSEFVYENLIYGFPYIDEDNFIEYLNEVIDKYNIEYIFPAHDSASVVFSRHRDQIHAEVICTEYPTVDICRSKSKTYEYFAEETFIPKTYEVDSVEEYPVFVKPTVGQGSVGAKKIHSHSELTLALEEDPSLVICEYLPGTEYSVDCFTDRHGKLRVVKLRDRQRIRAGISVRSEEMETNPEIISIAECINSKLKFRGAWFFQVKRNLKEEFKLMEISPRIPGTMGLSRNLGINFPMLTLFDYWGYDVKIIDNNYKILLDRAFYSAYKIDYEYNHVYVDFDDTLVINGKVNGFLISFLYQAISAGKKIHLLSKHAKDIRESLAEYRIAESLFDEITVIAKEADKADYIRHEDAIFIDDSFGERINIQSKLGIAVFDLDMVESLYDWRS